MLEIKNLSFGYKNHLALNNLSLTLLDNKIGVILGKNGAGKSTLFKNILGILKPNEGSIIIDNIKLDKIKSLLFFMQFLKSLKKVNPS